MFHLNMPNQSEVPRLHGEANQFPPEQRAARPAATNVVLGRDFYPYVYQPVSSPKSRQRKLSKGTHSSVSGSMASTPSTEHQTDRPSLKHQKSGSVRLALRRVFSRQQSQDTADLRHDCDRIDEMASQSSSMRLSREPTRNPLRLNPTASSGQPNTLPQAFGSHELAPNPSLERINVDVSDVTPAPQSPSSVSPGILRRRPSMLLRAPPSFPDISRASVHVLPNVRPKTAELPRTEVKHDRQGERFVWDNDFLPMLPRTPGPFAYNDRKQSLEALWARHNSIVGRPCATEHKDSSGSITPADQSNDIAPPLERDDVVDQSIDMSLPLPTRAVAVFAETAMLRGGFSPSNTAPRQAMEVASIEARMTYMERRISAVEEALTRLKNEKRKMAVRPLRQQHNQSKRPAALQPTSAARMDSGKHMTWLDSTSETSSVDCSLPSTPPQEPLFGDPHFAYEPLQHLLAAAENEHASRKAFEADLISMRQELSVIRYDLGLPTMNAPKDDHFSQGPSKASSFLQTAKVETLPATSPPLPRLYPPVSPGSRFSASDSDIDHEASKGDSAPSPRDTAWTRVRQASLARRRIRDSVNMYNLPRDGSNQQPAVKDLVHYELLPIGPEGT